MRLRLAIAVSTGLALVGLAFFQWEIIDLVTPFGWLPLRLLSWGAALVVALTLGVLDFRARRVGPVAFAPTVTLVTLALASQLLPLTEWWLAMNFSRHRAAREAIVAQVRAGSLKPEHDGELIPVGGASMSGEALVQVTPAGPFVFFFTFRGVLDNYSGFLWVPDGEVPGHFRDADEPGTELVARGGNWFFFSHR